MKNGIGTPYDDAFRTLLAQCPQLIIPVVNEMFGEHFSGDEEVILGTNERMIIDGENIVKKVTDSNFTIARRKRYHLESQATDDGTIAFRMVQYDLGIALENAEYSNGSVEITYPSSGIIFLRCSKNTPDEITIRIQSGEDSLVVKCPTLKVCDYTVDEIFEKELYFLIPFHLFVYEKSFAEYNEDEEKLAELAAEYEDLILRLRDRMKKLPYGSQMMISIMNMTAGVTKAFTQGFSNVQEGVRIPMFGRVLEDEYYNGLMEERRKTRELVTEEVTKSVTESVTEEVTMEQIGKTIAILKKYVPSKEAAEEELVKECELSREKAKEYIEMYWQ